MPAACPGTELSQLEPPLASCGVRGGSLLPRSSGLSPALTSFLGHVL